MSETPQNPVPPPDLSSLLDRIRLRVLLELNCHQWGMIQSFDATTQSAKVQIAALRETVDTTTTPASIVGKPFPILLDVPVFVLAGGKAGLTMPIAAGDVCLVLFNDRDMDNFWHDGSVTVPNSGRAHDLSDGLAIVGFRTKASPLAGYSTTKTVLFNDTTIFSLGAKASLSNPSTSLLTVLTNLVTAVKGYTDTHGDTANATTLTALTAVQTLINQLLE